MGKSKLLLLAVSLLALAVIFIWTEKKEEAIQEETRREAAKEPEKHQETSWQWLEEQQPMYQLSETEINSTLKELNRRFPSKEERLKALALWRLGTPYKLGCLGEEAGRDKDPIFRTDVADCTVFVLTNIALLHSETLAEAREMMRSLNYQPDSKISFESRLHFSTDRNEVSPYFKDITREVIGAEKTKQKEIVLNKIKDDGQRLIDIDWEKSILLNYIPYQHINSELLDGLPSAVGIAFIRENDAVVGLDVCHEGFLFSGKTLIHTTLAQGKVVEENFLDYYFIDQNNPRFEGIILFEVGL